MRTHSPSRAFTLIELLVVISIIALLIAFLLPVLGPARRSAQFMVCIAQMQDFTEAHVSYVQDHNGFVVHPNWGPASGGWLYAVPRGNGWDAPQGKSFEARRQMRETGLLWDYLNGEGQHYYCPTDNGPYDNQPGDGLPPIPVRAMTSYQFNGAFSGYGGRGLPDGWDTNSHDDFRPNDIMMWECDVTTTRVHGGFWNDAGNRPDEGLEVRHIEGAPIARIDGSAERIAHDEYYRIERLPQKNELWCNPGTTNGR